MSSSSSIESSNEGPPAYIIDHRWLRILSFVFYVLCALWSFPLVYILYKRYQRLKKTSSRNSSYFQFVMTLLFSIMFVFRTVGPITFAILFYKEPIPMDAIQKCGSYAFSFDFTSMAIFFEIFTLVLFQWILIIRMELTKVTIGFINKWAAITSSPLAILMIPMIIVAFLQAFDPSKTPVWGATAAIFIILPSVILTLATIAIGIGLVITFKKTSQQRSSSQNLITFRLIGMVVAFIAAIMIRIIASPIALLVFTQTFNRNIGFTLANPLADSLPACLLLGLNTKTVVKEYLDSRSKSTTNIGEKEMEAKTTVENSSDQKSQI
eukprot:gb/GECH01014153.1/.p1 GENE.gb/GECH01014153.1/~~gb/GECH01014153.1/.p1  ORF type:complete len:323 (+),score=56.93 gb/GECH01014153.1/:1-969(+)